MAFGVDGQHLTVQNGVADPELAPHLAGEVVEPLSGRPRFEVKAAWVDVTCSIPRNPSYLGSNSQSRWSNGADRSSGRIGWMAGRALATRGLTRAPDSLEAAGGPPHEEDSLLAGATFRLDGAWAAA